MEAAITESSDDWRVHTTKSFSECLKVATSTGVVVVSSVPAIVVVTVVVVIVVAVVGIVVVVPGVVVASVAVIGISRASSTYGAALVVDWLNAREVGGDSENGVECISLSTGLRSSS